MTQPPSVAAFDACVGDSSLPRIARLQTVEVRTASRLGWSLAEVRGRTWPRGVGRAGRWGHRLA